MSTTPVESEVTPLKVVNSEPQALAVRHEAGPLSVSQMKEGLMKIHQVMKDCMEDGKDYGKVPGCGDKPGLFQPGAQKLSMMFQLNPEVQKEEITDYPNYHRGFRLIVRVTAGSKFADGVGECSTLESKYRYRNSGRKCPECGKETIIQGKPEYGGGWVCYAKKGGCGWKCVDGSDAAKALLSQATVKVEYDNPADHWNTVRKMAFKRAFVHAIINATNTSELWSQDLEDLAGNGVVRPEASEPPPATSTRPERKNSPTGTQGTAKATPEGDWQGQKIPKFMATGRNAHYQGKTLGDMKPEDLQYWCQNYEPELTGSYAEKNKQLRAWLDTAEQDLMEQMERGADDVPMGNAPAADNTKEETAKKAILQVLFKQIKDPKDIPLLERHLQNEQVRKFGRIVLGFNQKLDTLQIEVIEYLCQNFSKWYAAAVEWTKKNP